MLHDNEKLTKHLLKMWVVDFPAPDSMSIILINFHEPHSSGSTTRIWKNKDYRCFRFFECKNYLRHQQECMDDFWAPKVAGSYHAGGNRGHLDVVHKIWSLKVDIFLKIFEVAGKSEIIFQLFITCDNIQDAYKMYTDVINMKWVCYTKKFQHVKLL